MKIIYNNVIPFKGFTAINLFGILFARKDAKIAKRTIQHESIHTLQMKELLYIGFYIWYFIEWIIRIFQYGFNINAHRNISFEREAYNCQSVPNYLQVRKRYKTFYYLNHGKRKS